MLNTHKSINIAIDLHRDGRDLKTDADIQKEHERMSTTYKGESLELNGWRLPTKEEINRIYKLGNEDKAISKQLLGGESYWTLDGDKTERNSNNPQNGTYVRCVHDLTPGEIELIEKQGEK